MRRIRAAPPATRMTAAAAKGSMTVTATSQVTSADDMAHLLAQGFDGAGAAPHGGVRFKAFRLYAQVLHAFGERPAAQRAIAREHDLSRLRRLVNHRPGPLGKLLVPEPRDDDQLGVARRGAFEKGRATFEAPPEQHVHDVPAPPAAAEADMKDRRLSLRPEPARAHADTPIQVRTRPARAIAPAAPAPQMSALRERALADTTSTRARSTNTPSTFSPQKIIS